MEINQLQPGQFADLFPSTDTGQGNQAPKFGSSERNVDLFATIDTTTIAATTDTTTLASTTDTTTSIEGTTDTTTAPDTDLFGDEKKAGRPNKYDFKDASGYFEDRIKNGKFVAIEEEDAQGNKVPFVPKTPEDFDEVIEIQINNELQKRTKGLNEGWYQSKSPAWQAVARYAEMADEPSEIIPFIQGIRNIQSVFEIDETTPEGAEQIVRTRMLQKGEQDDVITEQIDALKGADKLISTAGKYKPIILNEEKVNLQALTQQKQQEEYEYHALVADIRKNAITAIESPIFGKQKLKRDEQAAVYDLIAEPDPQSKGYGIYSVIDALFERRDFETLKQVALLLTKKENFLGYISNSAADKTAEGFQRKLRATTESRGSTTNDNPTGEQRETVQRNQFKSSPRFGR